jgi:hypothetical protein
MTLAEVIYQKSRDLPPDKASEVIDFIEFIKARREPLREASETEASQEAARQEALAYLSAVRIDWGGKPIPSRDELYDDARG